MAQLRLRAGLCPPQTHQPPRLHRERSHPPGRGRWRPRCRLHRPRSYLELQRWPTLRRRRETGLVVRRGVSWHYTRGRGSRPRLRPTQESGANHGISVVSDRATPARGCRSTSRQAPQVHPKRRTAATQVLKTLLTARSISTQQLPSPPREEIQASRRSRMRALALRGGSSGRRPCPFRTPTDWSDREAHVTVHTEPFRDELHWRKPRSTQELSLRYDACSSGRPWPHLP